MQKTKVTIEGNNVAYAAITNNNDSNLPAIYVLLDQSRVYELRPIKTDNMRSFADSWLKGCSVDYISEIHIRPDEPLTNHYSDPSRRQRWPRTEIVLKDSQAPLHALTRERQPTNEELDRIHAVYDEQSKVAILADNRKTKEAIADRAAKRAVEITLVHAQAETERKVQAVKKELTGQNLKQAIRAWTGFMGKGKKDQKIATAVQHYLEDSQRSYRRTGKEFSVSHQTILRWFTDFEERTGYHVPRSAPGTNLTLRSQAEMETEPKQKTLRAKQDGEDILIPMTETQKESIDDNDVSR